MNESIFFEKKKYSKLLKDYYNFKSKNRPTGLIILKNESDIDFLLDGLEILSADFVIKTEIEFRQKVNVAKNKNIKKDLLIGFDFLLTDNDFEGLNEFFKKGIVPIIPSNNHLSRILKEFDPLLSEGNSFLYQDKNKWSIYYAIIRYLENYKFSFDNRVLVKNIFNI